MDNPVVCGGSYNAFHLVSLAAIGHPSELVKSTARSIAKLIINRMDAHVYRHWVVLPSACHFVTESLDT